jgi:hypothetical protein
MAQCTARSKRTGERCKAKAMTGKDKCYHHGGKSRVGALSTAFRHGRHSKYLPEQMLERYNVAQQDPERLALADEIALIDTAITQLIEDVTTFSDPDRLDSLRALVEQRRKLTESERKRLQDLEQMIPADRAMTMIATILSIIKRHVHDVATLAAIQEDFRNLLIGTTGEYKPDIIDGDQ